MRDCLDGRSRPAIGDGRAARQDGTLESGQHSVSVNGRAGPRTSAVAADRRLAEVVAGPAQGRLRARIGLVTVLDLARDRRVWAAVTIELVVQFVAVAALHGLALGLVVAVDFGVFAGYLAWLWDRGPTSTSTTGAAHRPDGG